MCSVFIDTCVLKRRYATKAKKVDVRRLKTKMWAHIDSRAASAQAAKAAAAAVETDTTTAPDETVESETAADGGSLCFSSVLNDVASNVSVLLC
jgi:Condensin complex subunit 2